MAVIYAFRPPTPPNAALELGLAKTLAVYREWAGELADGGDAVLLNDRGGALFVEAAVSAPLAAVMPFGPSPELLRLHPSRRRPRRPGAGARAAHAVRLRLAGDRVHVAPPRRLRAGRRELPRGVGPRVAAAARGAAPRLRPRHAVPAAPPAARPVPAPRHGVLRAQEEEEEPRRRRRRRRGRRRRARHGGARQDQGPLHQGVRGGCQGACVVVAVAVAAWVQHVRERGRPPLARGLAAGEATTLRVSVNGRTRMRPAVPRGYFGNLVLWAFPRCAAGELASRPVQHAAELIRRAVARADDAYFRSFVDFASSGAVEAEGLAATADESQAVLCPDVEVDSWLGIDFYELDFGGGGGGGGPFYFTPSYLPMEGTVFLVPSFAGDGGIDAYVALFETHLDEFKKICYTY
ncbi:hypothetical protein EE612_026696 [Oryza sativa]|nr:hypothetical protein EE612_026696 [Oryza sativa]